MVAIQRPLDRETLSRHDIRILATDDGKQSIKIYLSFITRKAFDEFYKGDEYLLTKVVL